jgi:hypothetical protein
MPTPREIIDPNQTIPPVDLQVRGILGSDDNFIESIRIVDPTSGRVGICHIATNPEEMYFDGIEVKSRFRGGGFGLSAYVEAIELAEERGLTFRTQDYIQSPHAKRIWELLARLGVAQEIVPFREDTSLLHPRAYRGHYQVLPMARQTDGN